MEQHPALALLMAVTQLLDEAGDLSLVGLSGPELEMLIEGQLALCTRVGGQLAESIGQALAVDRPGELRAGSPAGWLRGRFGVSPRLAGRLVRELSDLRAAPVAAYAARAGAIPLEAAVEIGHAVAALPAEVGAELRAEGEEVLLGFAVGRDGPALDAGQLRFVGRHLHEVLDPESADVLLAQRLDREEAAAYRRRYLSLVDDGMGGVRIRGLVTAEAGAILRAVLGSLAAPAPARCADTETAGKASANLEAGAGTSADPEASADANTSADPEAGAKTDGEARAEVTARADAPAEAQVCDDAPAEAQVCDDASAAGQAAAGAAGAGGVGAGGGARVDGRLGVSLIRSLTTEHDDSGAAWVADERTPGQRLADALVEAGERLLAHAGLPSAAGERPQLVVTVDYESLAAGVGVGRLADGEELSAGVVRRLACDAAIIPAVLGSASQPLDLGRSARIASPAQRRMLSVRDGGCAFPGCDRPPGWCQAHHLQHWEDLGPTDLGNLVLLCGFHHALVHQEQWEIRPPTNGVRPLFVPPIWIDPQRRARRNHLHHTRDLLRAPP